MNEIVIIALAGFTTGITTVLFGFGGGSMANLFSTHPPLEERIARLQEMSRQAR